MKKEKYKNKKNIEAKEVAQEVANQGFGIDAVAGKNESMNR